MKNTTKIRVFSPKEMQMGRRDKDDHAYHESYAKRRNSREHYFTKQLG
jgi:hypothetical protein